MSRTSEQRHQIEALRGRISALTAAILRISASLDLDSALQEIVEDAVIDGFTPGQAQRISDRTDNMQVFETLRDLPSPVRVAGQFPESGRILPPCSAYPRLLAAPCTEPQLWDRASSGMDSGGRPH